MDMRDAIDRLSKIKTDEDERKNDFTIAFSGVFSSGKSSVLNYFLGCRDFMLPVGDFPITKVITRIKYGSSLSFYCVIGNSGERKKVNKGKFEKLVVGHQPLPKGCKEIVIEVPSKILENGVVFVDTPGYLDEMGGELEKMSREAVLKCDLAIFCTSAASLGHQFEREYIEELEESIGNYCMIVNHMDCCNTEDDEEDIQKKAAFLMKSKGGPYLSNLFGRNYFFTIAAGPGKTLKGFDSYLSYALGDMRLREQLKKASAEKIAGFRKQMLALEVETEIEILKEELEKTMRLHYKREAELKQENNMIKLDNKRERSRLTGVYEAALNEATKQVEATINSLASRNIIQDFTKQSREAIQSCYLAVAEKADIELHTDAERTIQNWFDKEMSSTEIPEPKRTVIRRRGFFERVAGAVENIFLFETIDPDIIIDPEYVYGYTNYQGPALNLIKNTLCPKLMKYLESVIDQYDLKEGVPVETGLEAHIDNMKQLMNEWREILKRCKE